MSIRFTLPDDVGRDRIEASLSKREMILADTHPVGIWHIFDTFDRRLFAKSLLLRWSGEELVLHSNADSEPQHHLQLSAPPRFASDLPEHPLRSRLENTIELRALLRLVTVHTRSWTYRILNSDEKTVARLSITEGRLISGEDAPLGATYLTVRPLRGYDKEAVRLAEQLYNEISVTPANDDIYLWALRAAGQLSNVYTTKLDVQLSPDLPSGKATRLVLRRLLEMMRANEEGIKADTDVEFLHDYRILLRRTRSALSQMRKVFPKEKTSYFRQAFRTLGQLTNDLRDLDVYLATENSYRAILPNAMQEDITPLFDYLRSHRSEALAAVVAGLNSEAYASLINDWDSFLHEPLGDNDPADAFMPVSKTARKRIIRQYRNIVRDGTLLLERGEDELLHTLRIECKELRYLQEFFAGLFSPEEVAPLIKLLKQLQDNLGAYTDLAVQQVRLLSIAEALDIDEVRARRALVSTGFLVESMARKQREIRSEFTGIFHNFASPAHQRQFFAVYGRGKGGKS